MRPLFIVSSIAALIFVGIIGVALWSLAPAVFFRPTISQVSPAMLVSPKPQPSIFASPGQPVPTITQAAPDFEVVAHSLEIPWEIAFLPDKTMLVTERPGRLLKITPEKQLIPIQGVQHTGEGGLLGLAIHPRFTTNQWIYVYLTTQTPQGLFNVVKRYRLADNTVHDETVILDGIPGSSVHDGGRLAFGPDGYLYISTGDAGKEQLAQATSSLAGKILRVNDDGSIPTDNPFNNPVYSYGHRNVQGLTWDSEKQLWATEHGRSGVRSGYDELNRIERGKNYGWPLIEGDETRSEMVSPVIHSGASDTWAPSGAVFFDNSILFTGLRGQALYQAKGISTNAVDLVMHLRNQYGRLRTVVVGPDGFLYISTNNRDGRGTVNAQDDKIIRINPSIFQ